MRDLSDIIKRCVEEVEYWLADCLVGNAPNIHIVSFGDQLVIFNRLLIIFDANGLLLSFYTTSNQNQLNSCPRQVFVMSPTMVADIENIVGGLIEGSHGLRRVSKGGHDKGGTNASTEFASHTGTVCGDTEEADEASQD